MADMTTVPLLDAQRAADGEYAKLRGLAGEEWDAQWARWRDAAAAVHAAISEHAAEHGLQRNEVEAAVKRAVRHPEA